MLEKLLENETNEKKRNIIALELAKNRVKFKSASEYNNQKRAQWLSDLFDAGAKAYGISYKEAVSRLVEETIKDASFPSRDKYEVEILLEFEKDPEKRQVLEEELKRLEKKHTPSQETLDRWEKQERKRKQAREEFDALPPEHYLKRQDTLNNELLRAARNYDATKAAECIKKLIDLEPQEEEIGSLQTFRDRKSQSNAYTEKLKFYLKSYAEISHLEGKILEKLADIEDQPSKKLLVKKMYLTRWMEAIKPSAKYLQELIQLHLEEDPSLSYQDAAKKAVALVPSYNKHIVEELLEEETDVQHKVALVKAMEPKNVGSTLPTSLFMFKYKHPELFSKNVFQHIPQTQSNVTPPQLGSAPASTTQEAYADIGSTLSHALASIMHSFSGGIGSQTSPSVQQAPLVVDSLILENTIQTLMEKEQLSYLDAATKALDNITSNEQKLAVALALFKKETDTDHKVALTKAIEPKRYEYSIPNEMFMFKYKNPELFRYGMNSPNAHSIKEQDIVSVEEVSDDGFEGYKAVLKDNTKVLAALNKNGIFQADHLKGFGAVDTMNDPQGVFALLKQMASKKKK